MTLEFQSLGPIPSLPGVYLFHSAGEVVYVGKSKHLKERVRSYFSKKHERKKLYIMMKYVDDLSYIVTDSNLEAELLEYRLIQKYKPLYNSQYTRGKKTVYLTVDGGLRLAEKGFGPLGLTKGLRRFLKALPLIYPIRGEGGFSFKKSLLTPRLSPEEREENDRSLEELLRNGEALEGFYDRIVEKMQAASAALAFEEALYFKELAAGVRGYLVIPLKKQAFHKKPRVLFSDDGRFFYIAYRGHIVAKDRVENRALYTDRSYRIRDNRDCAYRNIIYAAARRDGLIGQEG